MDDGDVQRDATAANYCQHLLVGEEIDAARRQVVNELLGAFHVVPQLANDFSLHHRADRLALAERR